MCGSGTTSSIDPRGSFTASVSPNSKLSMAGIGSASVNISGCILPTSQDCVRKSRSQGGENEQHKIFLSKSHADESMIRALFSQSANKCFSYLMHLFYKLAIENCCCNETYQNINLDQQCMKSKIVAAFLVNS